MVGIDTGAERLIALARASGRPPIEQMDPGAARQAVRTSAPLLAGTVVEMARVHDTIATGRRDPIELRIYRPLSRVDDPAAPAMLFLHGGGWVVGDLDTHDGLCRALAAAGACVVIAVDYRLAPKHAFPAALEDAIDALEWAAGNAALLGIDPGRIGVAGDSAGGNLAAVLALSARDGSVSPVAFQCLFYPICDLSMTQDSYDSNGVEFLLTSSSMRYFIDCYAGGQKIADDWRAAPLLVASVAGVAPALVLTAGHDPLCDEGKAYAVRIREEGVAVTHIHRSGQIHGFLTAPAIITEAAEVIDEIGNYIRSVSMMVA